MHTVPCLKTKQFFFEMIVLMAYILKPVFTPNQKTKNLFQLIIIISCKY